MMQIAIIDEANQQFGIVINSTRITMRVYYSSVSERWSFDISIDDLPVLHGRRLVCGADLVAPFNLGIGAVVAYALTPGSEPDRAALPDGRVGLFLIPPDEL